MMDSASIAGSFDKPGLSTKQSLLDEQLMQDDMNGEIGSKSKQTIPERPDGGANIVSPKQDDIKEQKKLVDYKRALLEGPKSNEAQGRNNGKKMTVALSFLERSYQSLKTTEEYVEWLKRQSSQSKGDRPTRWLKLNYPGTPRSINRFAEETGFLTISRPCIYTKK